MESTVLFESVIYKEEIPEYLNLDKVCDKYIKKAREDKKNFLEEKRKEFKVDVGDHGISYHSPGDLYKEPEFEDFELLVKSTAKNVLESQGFDMSNHMLKYTEMWVQEFADKGGGHHDTHIHWDNHISGFYFLKCSSRTSKPIFHDPRPGRMMLNLPIKDPTKLCYAMERQIVYVKPGSLVLFNSYLPHQFTVDDGVDPFRFIHFNMQATITAKNGQE